MRAALLVLGLLTVGCKDYECVRSKSVHHPAIPDQYVYWPTDNGPGLGITPYGMGIHMGGGIHLVLGTAAWDGIECAEWREVTH